jgi:hypothetical protein
VQDKKFQNFRLFWNWEENVAEKLRFLNLPVGLVHVTRGGQPFTKGGQPFAERLRRHSRLAPVSGWQFDSKTEKQYRLPSLIWFTVGEYADATFQRKVTHLY